MTKPKPKIRLSNMKLSRFALVDAGDNPGAHVLMTKAKTDDAKPSLIDKMRTWFAKSDARTTNQILGAERFHDEFWKLRYAFTRSVEEIISLPPSDDMAKVMAKTVSEFVAGAKALVADVTKGDKASERALLDILDSLVSATGEAGVVKNKDALADAIARLEKFEAPAPQETPEDPVTAPAKKTLEDVIKGLPEAEAAVVKAALEAQKTEAKPEEKPADPAPDAIAKMVNDAVAKATADLAAKAAKTEADFNALRDQTKKAERIAKARALGVAGPSLDDVAMLIGMAEEKGEEAVKALEKTLRATSAQNRKGARLEAQIGTSQDTPPETAADEIEKAVVKMRSTDPKLTYEQAYAAVLKADPELMERAMEEVGEGEDDGDDD